jgi:hypothetical protein
MGLTQEHLVRAKSTDLPGGNNPTVGKASGRGAPKAPKGT